MLVFRWDILSLTGEPFLWRLDKVNKNILPIAYLRLTYYVLAMSYKFIKRKFLSHDSIAYSSSAVQEKIVYLPFISWDLLLYFCSFRRILGSLIFVQCFVSDPVFYAWHGKRIYEEIAGNPILCRLPVNKLRSLLQAAIKRDFLLTAALYASIITP